VRAVWLIAMLAACGTREAPVRAPVDDLELDPRFDRREKPSWSDEEVAEPDAAPRVDEPVRQSGGALIDVVVKDAPIADVLHLIANAAHVNLVVPDDVKGTITIDVRRVTWRQAIEVIAELEGLAVEEADGIVTVTRK
jgi:type II secretory pathway component HofQ